MPNPFTPPAGQLGAMAAVVATPGLPPAPIAGGTAEGLDGELIRLCDRFCAVEAEYLRLTRLADIASGETDPAKVAAAAEAEAARDELLSDRLLGRIAELPARTPEGLRAKARAAFAFFNPSPPEYSSAGGPVLWSIICDLAGEDATAVEREPGFVRLAGDGRGA